MADVIQQSQKIDIIFSYLFSDKKALQEEKFWNKLSTQELNHLENIDNEEFFDFNLLKQDILGK